MGVPGLLGSRGTHSFLRCRVQVPSPFLKTTEAGSFFTPRQSRQAHLLALSLHREEYSSPGISGGSLSPGRGIWLAPKVMFTLQAIDSQSDPAPSMSQVCRSLCCQHGLRVTRLGLPGHSVIHRLCDLGPVVALPEPQFPLLVNMDDNSCPFQGLWRGRGMQRASSQAWPRSKVQNMVPQPVRVGRGRVERRDRGPGNSPIHTASPLVPGTRTWMF